MNDSILLLFSKLLCGHNHVPTRENIDTEICRHDRHKKRFYFQKKKKIWKVGTWENWSVKSMILQLTRAYDEMPNSEEVTTGS